MALCERYAVADVDSHIIEPADLWTSRISPKWGDLVPHVRFHERRQEDYWYIGDHKLYGVGAFAQAQWHEFPPSHPTQAVRGVPPRRRRHGPPRLQRRASACTTRCCTRTSSASTATCS